MKIEKYNILKEEAICVEVLAEILQDDSSELPLLIGLCGGRSIAQMLRLLDEIEISRAIVALTIDERALPLESPDSNYYLLKEEIGKTINLKTRINLLPFNIEKEDDSMSQYLSVLKKHSGIFDLVFLGIGEDGHIASIFPNLNISHSVEEDYFIFEGSPKPPSRRITASHKIIEQAKNSILLILGEGKRQAYENLLNPSLSPMDCPAKYALESGRSIIFTDLD